MTQTKQTIGASTASSGTRGSLQPDVRPMRCNERHGAPRLGRLDRSQHAELAVLVAIPRVSRHRVEVRQSEGKHKTPRQVRGGVPGALYDNVESGRENLNLRPHGPEPKGRFPSPPTTRLADLTNTTASFLSSSDGTGEMIAIPQAAPASRHGDVDLAALDQPADHFAEQEFADLTPNGGHADERFGAVGEKPARRTPARGVGR